MSNLTKTIVLVVALLCIVQLAFCQLPTIRATGKHCTENRKINETVTVTETQPVRVLKHEWCLSTTSFRCTKYVTEVRTVTKEVTIEKTVNVSVCCPGYAESPNNGYCYPMCDSECQNGVCLWSGECQCKPGYMGENCIQPCNSNLYGLNCTETCKCQNGGTCHHITGECNCMAGWVGEFCATPIQAENLATPIVSDDTKDSFLFDIVVSSDKLAELSRKLSKGDWVFSVSARRVKPVEEAMSPVGTVSMGTSYFGFRK